MKEEEFKQLLQKTIKESIEQNIKPLKEAEIYQCPNCNKTFSYDEWQGNNWRCPNTECAVEVEPPKPTVLVLKEKLEAPAEAPAEGEQAKEIVEARKKIVELEAKNQDLEKQLKECSEKREKIVNMIESIIPSPQVVYSHGQTGGFKRLTENIKKLKHDVENL